MWRNELVFDEKWSTRPAPVILPGSTEELQSIVNLCNRYRIAFKLSPLGFKIVSLELASEIGHVGEAPRGMFIHLKQSQQVMSSFPELEDFQIVVSRVEYRDHLTLRIELKEDIPNRESLGRSLSEKFKDVCRLSPDEIIFLEPGGLANEKKVLVDQREY